jgi:hypothetical protein
VQRAAIEGAPQHAADEYDIVDGAVVCGAHPDGWIVMPNG